ncbi:uncharacterized protein V6R79_009994 [Siganus canaliculatus]
MSFTFIVMMMLLGSSVVMAFVLQPSHEEPAASANAPVSHHRCQVESLQSIRKRLLSSLNLQVEPQLPAGGLDRFRQHLRNTLAAHMATDTAVPAVSVHSDQGDSENGTSLRCCSTASEISMKDLGWDNWVIHPMSLTMVGCALCSPDANVVQCPSSHNQDGDSQVPCCQPTSETMVPVAYMDDFNNMVISSVRLTRSCGCGQVNARLPSEE